MDAALRAWGRESFKKMSLSALAVELKATKTAIYRHFPSKKALLEALDGRFFDEYAARLKEPVPVSKGDDAKRRQGIDFIFDRALAPFAENRDLFAFFYFHILDGPCPFHKLKEELESRGAMLRHPRPGLDDEGMALNFAFLTGMFGLFIAHMRPEGLVVPPGFSGPAALAAARDVTSHGLRMSPIAPCDYPALESLASLSAEETGPGQPLLESVAKAVAEAGLWNATMDMVATGAGLSKSGLYAHFRSREDALSSMFTAEFERIVALSGERCSRVTEPSCRLFLTMATTANYLRARPEVLATMRWVMIQHIAVKPPLPKQLAVNGAFLLREAAAGRCSLIGGSLDLSLRWLHFLVVDLIARVEDGDGSQSAESALRGLHRLVLGGIEAAKTG